MHGNIIFHCAVSVIYRNNRYKNMTDKKYDISLLASINTNFNQIDGMAKNCLDQKPKGFSRIFQSTDHV